MRVNKKGQFFSIYLVLLTLTMCLIVMVIYSFQKDNVENSLVSPKAVLEVEDGLEIFEMREKEIIVDSINSILLNSESKSIEDIQVGLFRSDFLNKVSSDNLMKKFLLEDLTLEGRPVSSAATGQIDDFLKNVLYKEEGMRIEGGFFVIERSKIGKMTTLYSGSNFEKDEINFPVDFSFEFERKYLISLDSGKIIVEEE